MGYTTYFNGAVEISPPLSEEEVSFINKFGEKRHEHFSGSLYYVDGMGMTLGDKVTVEGQYHHPEVPGLYCQWVVSEDGKSIEWDGEEKFYEADAWMEFIIEHLIGTKPKAQAGIPFLTGHTCNGDIYAEGEESEDHWMIKVRNNKVEVKQGHVVYDE